MLPQLIRRLYLGRNSCRAARATRFQSSPSRLCGTDRTPAHADALRRLRPIQSTPAVALENLRTAWTWRNVHSSLALLPLNESPSTHPASRSCLVQLGLAVSNGAFQHIGNLIMLEALNVVQHEDQPVAIEVAWIVDRPLPAPADKSHQSGDRSSVPKLHSRGRLFSRRLHRLVQRGSVAALFLPAQAHQHHVDCKPMQPESKTPTLRETLRSSGAVGGRPLAVRSLGLSRVAEHPQAKEEYIRLLVRRIDLRKRDDGHRPALAPITLETHSSPVLSPRASVSFVTTRLAPDETMCRSSSSDASRLDPFVWNPGPEPWSVP